MAAALSIVWLHFRRAFAANWPLVAFALILGYSFGFSGGLNPYWVLLGTACAVAIRLRFYPQIVWYIEAVTLGYIVCRSVDLLLML